MFHNLFNNQNQNKCNGISKKSKKILCYEKGS